MQLLNKNEFILSVLTAEANKWLWSPVWENTECLCGVNMVQRKTHLKSWDAFGFSEALSLFFFKSVIVFPRECEIHVCECSQGALQRALALGIACGCVKEAGSQLKADGLPRHQHQNFLKLSNPSQPQDWHLSGKSKGWVKLGTVPLWNTTPAVQNLSSRLPWWSSGFDTTLPVQGGQGSIPGQVTRSRLLQLKILCATTKTQGS